jgi:hypothetical protein
MTRIQHPLELLAPAKNADFGIEAIKHGADAVYIGGPAFGARYGKAIKPATTSPKSDASVISPTATGPRSSSR